MSVGIAEKLFKVLGQRSVTWRNQMHFSRRWSDGYQLTAVRTDQPNCVASKLDCWKNFGNDTLCRFYLLPYPCILTSGVRSYQVVGIAWAMHVGSDERIASWPAGDIVRWPRGLDVDWTSKQSLHVLDVFDRVAQDLDLRQSLRWSGRIGARALLQRFECHVYLYASSSSSSSLSSSNKPKVNSVRCP